MTKLSSIFSNDEIPFTEKRMSTLRKNIKQAFCALLLLSCLSLECSSATDTITATHYLKDPETVVSRNDVFTLGFFSPPNSSYRYVGIWYSRPSVRDVIWVANKNNPLINDSSGTIKIAKDGNLQVYSSKNVIFWSSNVSNITGSGKSSAVRLQDSGNLVLGSEGGVLWQSFDHPTDTFLPNMNLTITKGYKNVLRSWKSQSDPYDGRFTAGLDIFTLPQLVIWDGDRRHWRSGPWNGNMLIGVQFNYIDVIDAQIAISGDDRNTIGVTYSYPNKTLLSTYMLSTEGKITQIWWDDGKKKWEVQWEGPAGDCDQYGKCGAFGTCNSERPTAICQCLKGFEPSKEAKWSQGDWSDGCVRKSKLQCESGHGKEDGFLRLEMMKVPDQAEWRRGLSNEDGCRSQCLKNCSCLAYAYDTFIGCMTWSTSLIDIQEFAIGGVNLYLRLANSELDTHSNSKAIKALEVVGGSLTIMVLVAALSCFLWRHRAHRQLVAKKKEREEDPVTTGENPTEAKLKELPLFKVEILAAATNNFQESNKLGRGGFGSVYRGILDNGQEIAVKRLSRASRQGTEEFMNEVKVISKLQHRNLVRLLGCSVEGEEKMLVYEYMPNKSLDAFLFVPGKQQELDWDKRFNIIKGICRGLQYLHKDSRLKIIHRDLKASNILLDQELDPKISDFGMARIFGGDEDEADTRRVVGTYGYMPPEYAMQGLFSEKSDVFSFGVLLLEIISGNWNGIISDKDQSLTLLGHAWKLWNEKSMINLIDPVICIPHHQKAILRCVNVGLLSVQEFAKDRPSISTVMSMLNGEISDLPHPNKPGFALLSEKSSSQQSQQETMGNYMSVTMISGR